MADLSNSKATFDLKRVQPVTLSLLNGQVDIILRALELYGYNLEFMLNTNGESITNKEKDISKPPLYIFCVFSIWNIAGENNKNIYKTVKKYLFDIFNFMAFKNINIAAI